jgi:hypothetical protein
MLQRICSLIGLSLALAALGTPVMRAVLAAPSVATYTVDSTLDEPDADINDGVCSSTPSGKCTLRAAVMQANVVNVDTTIQVPAGVYTLTIPPVLQDGPETGDLNLTTPASDSPVISIVGAGADSTIIDGNGTDRVMSIDFGRTASISGVAIRNGYVSGVGGSGGGGGIYNNGSLTVSGSTLTGNHASTGGGIYDIHSLTVLNSIISQNMTVSSAGGIFSSGDLNVRNSTVEANSTGGLGGGIETDLGLTMRNSTISGNQAHYGGGGIYNLGALTAMNSTISQNTDDTSGGGIYNSAGTASVYNATIVFNAANPDGNVAGGGGGVFNDDANSATFNLRNTLLAGNYSSNAFSVDDCGGTLHAFGRNLFGSLLPNCSISGIWTSLNSINLIGPLQNNGGPTLTHALLPGSNAIDSAFICVDYASNPLLTDQRGAARVVGAACDIGAFEYRPPLYLPLVVR